MFYIVEKLEINPNASQSDNGSWTPEVVIPPDMFARAIFQNDSAAATSSGSRAQSSSSSHRPQMRERACITTLRLRKGHVAWIGSAIRIAPVPQYPAIDVAACVLRHAVWSAHLPGTVPARNVATNPLPRWRVCL